MLFNSYYSLFFFLAGTLLHFILPFRFRLILLLAASYYFSVCGRFGYLFLIIAQTFVFFAVCGLMLVRPPNPRRRHTMLRVSLGAAFSLRSIIKYYNFLNKSIRALFERHDLSCGMPQSHLLLPVGISLYTLQAVSYITNIYQSTLQPELQLGRGLTPAASLERKGLLCDSRAFIIF